MYLFQVTYPQFRWFLSSVWLSLRVGSFPTTPTAADDRSLMKLKLLRNRQRTNFIHAPMTFTGLPPPSASRNQHLVISIINKCAGDTGTCFLSDICSLKQIHVSLPYTYLATLAPVICFRVNCSPMIKVRK